MELVAIIKKIIPLTGLNCNVFWTRTKLEKIGETGLLSNVYHCLETIISEVSRWIS